MVNGTRVGEERLKENPHQVVWIALAAGRQALAVRALEAGGAEGVRVLGVGYSRGELGISHWVLEDGLHLSRGIAVTALGQALAVLALLPAGTLVL